MQSKKQCGTVRIETDNIPSIHDESAHEASPLEWWFVHGYYEGCHVGRRHFMVTLFRQTAPDKANCFSLILSVLDEKTGRNEVLSQIEPMLLKKSVQVSKKRKPDNLDPHMVGTYLQEIEEYGPLQPIRLETNKIRMASSPFRAGWKDFALSQLDKTFRLEFTEPESRHRCRFHLHPCKPHLDINGLGEPYIRAMAYVNYPRLELKGKAGKEEVRGEAWLDHEWGNYGHFSTQSARARILGWDWFRFNLDDGSDGFVIIHRDMQSGKPVTQYAVISEKGKKPCLYSAVDAKPFGYWKSKTTHIRYPTAWSIRIPGIKADLVFTPLADDQEIPIFGIMRAIWEGAGTISGSISSRRVAGRARLELNGYGYIFDFQKLLKAFTARTKQHLTEFFPKAIGESQLREYVGKPQWKHEPAAYTPMLARPVWDLMSRESKCWRPIFGRLALEIMGVPVEPYEKLINVTMELCHTGALIIDDIEDDSKIRRGDKCIHLRYGTDVAINAGNTIYLLPYLLLSFYPSLSEKQRIEIFRILSQMFIRAHFGQTLDIYWSRNMSAQNLALWMKKSLGPKILQMYAYKTAAAVEGGAEVAAIIAHAEPATLASFKAMARIFGVAFQILDDVHNFSNSPKWTKTCGEDVYSGKLTYVIFRALKRLKTPARERLQKILCSKTLRQKPATFQEAVGLVRDSGALLSCRREAQTMFKKEWARFSTKFPPSEPKLLLRMLCSSMLNLEYES